ncbi:hypothetical protein DTO271G3_7307 [Paecilomyces variotii]|nr:hypothetical protein DTO271G3_7307 [Paecilomyces variotii]
MSLVELLLITGGLLLITVLIHRQRLATPNPPNAETNSSIEKINKCVNTISAAVAPDGRTNQLSQLQSRAIPSSRIARGFGVHNPFTTTDEAQAREFVRRARRCMITAKFEELTVLARKDIETFLANDPENGVSLASLIQIVTLSMALRVFIKDGIAATNLDQSLLLIISNFINEIWIDSKSPEKEVVYQEYHELHDALRAVCPHRDPLNPRENPLNWLLPSFESLWRIALRTFIEVKFSTGRIHPEWSRAMIEFARNPIKEQFEERFEAQSAHQGQTEISVQDIINEALRLYPPTRHIYRAFQFDTGDTWDGIADIESLHIDQDIWGADALEFHPERLNNLSDLQRKAFMPFGGDPFRCPAKMAFGPRAIALVVGVVLAVLEDGDWHMECNDPQVMGELNRDTRLSLRRDGYTNVVLRRGSG